MKKITKEIIENLADAEKLSPLLTGLGFSEGRKAVTNLDFLKRELKKENAFERLLPDILKSSIDSPDPDMALNNLERLASSFDDKDKFFSFLSGNTWLIPQLLLLLGSSQYLANFLFSSPEEYLDWISKQDLLKQPVSREAMMDYLRKQVKPETTIDEIKSILRRFRKREYLRVAVRDLAGYASLAEITLEISAIADACMQTAYEICNRDLNKKYGKPRYTDIDGKKRECTFTVLGMGKLGGEELNYSSDIDIMFLYTSDNGETESGLLNNHQYFVKLSEMICQVIGATTDEGFVFRVDTRLRPEGQRGDLACSLRSYEIYYESWGQTWERAALLKARPMAGDESLGRSFLNMIQPFVYRKYLDFTAIDEIRGMKAKIDRSIAIKGREAHDVKLGYGGIREIEFYVQSLQLLYGGKEPWVREKNTLRGLHRLAQKGIITFEEEDKLSKAYLLFRRIEHMIQIVGERQTHTMPTDAVEQGKLARRFGYKDKGRYKAHELMLNEFNAHRQTVRKIYDGLFVAKDTEEEERDVSDCELIISDLVSEEESVAILSKYHFRDPHKAYRNILLLRDGPPFSHQTPRSRQIFLRTFPEYFGHITSSSDPDLALNNLESLISLAGARETLYSFFEENPQAMESVIRLFSSSDYLSRILIRHPETIDLFLDPAEILKKRTKEEMQEELHLQLEQCAAYSDKLDALRKFKYTEELRIGYADILGYIDTITVTGQLSLLADVALAISTKIAEEELSRTYGEPVIKQKGRDSKARFCIAGMGKLGGHEITYGSDLDIIFIYSGEGETRGGRGISNHEYFTHLSSKIISALTAMTREGTVFKVDVRLRPSGTKGPLCQSIEAVSAYIREHAEIWEYQALTRVRVVAGDQTLGREFEEMIHQSIYKKGVKRSGLAGSVRQMRKRMEEEVSKEDEEHYDIKVGAGGIVDIEFIVQYLKLLHGAANPGVRVVNTMGSLAALCSENILTKEQYRTLEQSYIFLRTLESRLRIVHNMPSHLLPRRQEKLTSLANRMGYKDTGSQSASKKLLRKYENLRKKVRGLFDEILSDVC